MSDTETDPATGIEQLQTVNLSLADGVATIELNRPQTLNAWNGQFGADMQVALVNDGPVTIWIDTKDRE